MRNALFNYFSFSLFSRQFCFFLTPFQRFLNIFPNNREPARFQCVHFLLSLLCRLLRFFLFFDRFVSLRKINELRLECVATVLFHSISYSLMRTPSSSMISMKVTLSLVKYVAAGTICPKYVISFVFLKSWRIKN